jgi:hypothetical protein
VDPAKLGHVFRMSVAATAVTLTSTEGDPRVPPSMDIVAVKPIDMEGTLTGDRSLRPGPCPTHNLEAPHISGNVWRLKTGFAHELDLGSDFFDNVIKVSR